MQSSRRDFLKFTGTAFAGVAVGDALLRSVQAQSAGAALSPSNNDPHLHFLNRISYSVLPEDLTRVREIGTEAYLFEQLNPETLDDSLMDDMLSRRPILQMNRVDLHKLGFGERTRMALIEAAVLRAVHSKRQLLERMVEFWTDHFNIPAEEYSQDLIVMHRDVVRCHALGKFRDLAIGVAQSPAMLHYLDQAYSDKEHPNENYARELLELHTLGVDGGYSENDVLEAARALTGWTVHDGTDTGFFFSAEMHDDGRKGILGHEMPSGRGIEDGLHLLSILVNHPETAKFISRKLCVRFVSDNPPQSLVDAVTQTWIDSGGDIKTVLTRLFLSEEFNNSVGMKFRRPLDFFIGALRATGTHFTDDYVMKDLLSELAQPPYGWQPPNGYPDVAGAWLSTSGLLARWNTAIALSHSAYSEDNSGMSNRLAHLIDNPRTVGELVTMVSQRVFAAPLPEAEFAKFVAFASDGRGEGSKVTPILLANKLGMLFGLILASPMYQWR